MAEIIGIGFWVFLSVYVVCGLLAGVLIKEEQVRKETMKWMSKAFIFIICMWILSLVLVSFLLAIVSL